MGQYVLGVLESLGHLSVVAVQGLAERHDRALTLLVHVRDQTVVRVQEDLCVVLEVHLDDFVAQAEHDRVARTHPLFDVDGTCGRLLFSPDRATNSPTKIILFGVLV